MSENIQKVALAICTSVALAVVWGGWQVREDVRAIKTVLALCGVCGEKPEITPSDLIPTVWRAGQSAAPDCCFGRDVLTRAAMVAVERIDEGDPAGARTVLEDALRVAR